jgi:hypothetical protein
VGSGSIRLLSPFPLDMGDNQAGCQTDIPYSFSPPSYLIDSIIHPLKLTVMTKIYSLFGGTTTDTGIRTVEVNQIIQMEGYSYDRYVVHRITHNEYGYHYHLINLRTLDMQQSEIIKPLSQKFGIGMYYDENNIEFMPEEEVAELYAKAQAKRVDEMERQRTEEKRREEVRVIGREWMRNNLPADAKAIIVARLKQDESDSQTDYFASCKQCNIRFLQTYTEYILRNA